jgi:hypothetical protein
MTEMNVRTRLNTLVKQVTLVPLICGMGLQPRNTHESTKPTSTQEATPPTALDGNLKLTLKFELHEESTRLVSECGDEVEPGSTGLAVHGDALQLEWEADWQDENRLLSGNWPTSFDRTYRRLGLRLVRSGEHGGSWQRSLVSPLEGVLHRWQRNVRTCDYLRSALSSSGNPPEISSLASDLSFSWILPGSRVWEKEESWELEAGDLVSSLWPGGFGPVGHLGRDDRSAELPMVHVAVVPSVPPDPLFWPSSVDGAVTAELKSVGPGQIAQIALDYDVDVTMTIKDWFGRAFSGSEEEGALPRYLENMNYDGGVTLSLKGEGEVWFALDGMLIDSIELNGDIQMQSNLQWSYSWDTPKIEEFFGTRSETWVGRIELAGSLKRRQ